jgi:hypothetical protein
MDNKTVLSDKRYKIIRYIIEEYESYGKNRREALDNLGYNGNPSKVTVTKEICKPLKP